MVASTVSSKMIESMAEHEGFRFVDCLTGKFNLAIPEHKVMSPRVQIYWKRRPATREGRILGPVWLRRSNWLYDLKRDHNRERDP